MNDRIYRELMESSHELVWCCDEKGRYTYLNSACERIYGYTIDEMLGRPFTDFQSPEIGERDARDLFRLLAVGPVIEYETFHIAKSGEEIALLLTVLPVTNADGEIIGARGVARDVTNERRTQADLRVRAAVIEATGDPLIVADADGVITLVNTAAERLFGRNRDELVGSATTILMPAEYDADHSAGLKRLREGSAPRVPDKSIEVEGLRADGTRFPAELQISPITGGNPAAFVATIRDITDRKKAEEVSSIRLAALDATAEIVVVTDANGTIEYVNKAFVAETGYEQAEVIGGNLRILKSGSQDPDFYRDLWDTIQAGKVWWGTLINRRKDGSEYPEEMTITPVEDADGEVIRFIAIKRNISERLRLIDRERESAEKLRLAAEQEAARKLEAENRELQRINDARTEFLSSVSHELRTPLNINVGVFRNPSAQQHKKSDY